jgi:predicted TIM-barrel fold metal-dependent hydrolase
MSTNPADEKPIEPLLPICDPHHHMWDRPGNRYMPEEFLQDVNGNNVVRTVFVECHSGYRTEGLSEMRPVGEIEFMQKISAQHARGKILIAVGIVGHANLTLGDRVTAVLEAHIAAGKGHFKGIRHSTAWAANVGSYMNSPQGLMMDSKFREGFARLGKLNLTFDAWLYSHQLPEVANLVKAFPDTRIIVDHIGGPLDAGLPGHSEIVGEGKKQIATLAPLPNVYIKLGGLGMPVCGFGWDKRAEKPGSTILAKAMAPFYLYCIEQCGVNRCMFESNFPVDKVSYSYTTMWNAFKLIVKDFTAAEKAALFHNTAALVYRLETG